MQNGKYIPVGIPYPVLSGANKDLEVFDFYLFVCLCVCSFFFFKSASLSLLCVSVQSILSSHRAYLVPAALAVKSNPDSCKMSQYYMWDHPWGQTNTCSRANLHVPVIVSMTHSWNLDNMKTLWVIFLFWIILKENGINCFSLQPFLVNRRMTNANQKASKNKTK